MDKDATSIQEMFSRVAPRYDLLNHILSGSLDIVWRRQAARSLELTTEARVLDLCCGTGDQALAIRKRFAARVVASDFCLPMLSLAQHKFTRSESPRPKSLAGDAQVLPFAARSFEAATVSFGLRNVANLAQTLSEIARVLKPGAQAVLLEFALPRAPLVKAAYLVYFKRILPTIGRLLSHRPSAYRYLPASVTSFPQRETFVAAMEQAGFEETEWTDLSSGIVCLYRGKRSA